MFRFSLARLLKRSRPRSTRPVVLRPIIPGAVQFARLERIYLGAVNAWWRQARLKIIPAYAAALAEPVPADVVVMDDLGTGIAVRLSSILSEVGDFATFLGLQLAVDLERWAADMEKWHRARWTLALQPHNVEITQFIGPEDVGSTLEFALRQNVSLVRNVSDTMRRAMEQIIFNGFQQRLPTRVIARQLADATGIQRKRALRISIDQTVKLSSQLDEERMRQAGLDEFQWLHSGKVHYRPHHRARDGHVFKWGEIPADDMPGIPPFCGCKKRAVIKFD